VEASVMRSVWKVTQVHRSGSGSHRNLARPMLPKISLKFIHVSVIILLTDRPTNWGKDTARIGGGDAIRCIYTTNTFRQLSAVG